MIGIFCENEPFFGTLTHWAAQRSFPFNVAECDEHVLPYKQERDPFTDLRRLLQSSLNFDWDVIRLRLNHIKRDTIMT